MSDAASVQKPFLRRPLGRATVVIGALVALGAGAAVAQGWGHRHGFGHGGPMGGAMGGGFERFCSLDPAYVTQKMADGLTTRLNLTDPQKASLADLRQSAVAAATDAKKLCAVKPDMTTTPGRLAAMQARLGAANTAMTTLKPKIEAFYATLDDAQKKQFDQMGPGGHGKRGWGGRGEGHMGGRMEGHMGGQMGGMGGMGWRRHGEMGGMSGMSGMGGMSGMAPKQ